MARKPMKTTAMGAMSVYGKPSPPGGWPGHDMATHDVPSVIPAKGSSPSASMIDGPYGKKPA